MTLRCEEMHSIGRYAHVTASASVFCCDHRDERGRCQRGYSIGLGMGDSVTDDDVANAEADGWSIGERDYCPDHAAAHNNETDEVEP